MRIPTYDGPRAQLSGQPLAAPRVPTEHGREALGQALAEGAHAIDQGAAYVARSMREDEARQQEARQQAIAKENTDGETDLTRYAIEKFHGRQGSSDARRNTIEEAFSGEPTQQKGYLDMKGDEAFESSAPTFDDLQKKQFEIADNMSTPEARERFLDRTARQMSGYFETVESHAGHQRQIANLATLNARKEAALEAVRANPNNLTEVEAQAHALNQPIAALGVSTEDRHAKAMEWHGEVATAQVAAQLERGDWQSAETTLKNKGGIIPAKATKALQADLERVKVGSLAQQTASEVVTKGLSEDGQVNQTAVLDEIDKVSPELREKVRPIAFQLMAEREQAYAADTARISRAAHTLYNNKGWGEFEKSGLSTELNYRNPALYERLRDDGREKYKAAKRAQSTSPADKAAQRETNKDARNAFLGLPIEEQASADLGEFLVGRGTGPVAGNIDPVPNEIKKLQTAARQQVEKGLGISRETFVTGLKASLQKYAPKPGMSRESRARAAAWWADHVSDGVNAYNLWVDNNPTKKPTTEDIAGMQAQVVGDLPPNPERPESIAESARALSIRAGGAGGPEPAKVPAISAAERKQIEDALRSKGRVITEDAVQALYKQVHGGR